MLAIHLAGPGVPFSSAPRRRVRHRRGCQANFPRYRDRWCRTFHHIPPGGLVLPLSAKPCRGTGTMVIFSRPQPGTLPITLKLLVAILVPSVIVSVLGGASASMGFGLAMGLGMAVTPAPSSATGDRRCRTWRLGVLGRFNALGHRNPHVRLCHPLCGHQPALRRTSVIDSGHGDLVRSRSHQSRLVGRRSMDPCRWLGRCPDHPLAQVPSTDP